MNIFKWIIKNTVINWKRPFYSKSLYEFSKRYLDFWYGDNNFDRHTNGEYRLLKELMPQCGIVFDVGANRGEYSGTILSINPKIKIRAFEPDSAIFEKLKALPLKAENMGLGEKEETKTLYRGERSVLNSFYSFDENKGNPLTVRVETIDGYCKKNAIEHIDFMKIDVEGYEYQVLRGGERMLKDKKIDCIQFEFSGATIQSRVFLKDFINMFDRFGYDLYRVKPLFLEKVIYYPDRERFTLTNYVALQREIDKKYHLTKK